MDVRRDCISLAQRKWMNGMPRAQDAQERRVSVLHSVSQFKVERVHRGRMDKVRPGTGREGALGYERLCSG
jgi:hypothetical protein